MADDFRLSDDELNPWAKPAAPAAGIGATKPIPAAELNPWGEPQESGLLGEASKGFRAGVEQLKGFGYGLGALAGEVTGIEPLKQASVRGLQDVEQTIQSKFAPAVGSYKDIGGLNDALKYATYGVATNLPNLLMALGAGGIGALAGKKLAGQAAREVAKKYMERGAMTGAGLTSVGMETGTIAGEQATEAGAVNPVTAIAGGLAAGALDFIPEWYLMKRMGWFGDEVKGAILRRAASGAAKQFAMEAPTEAAQSVIERAAVPGKSTTNAEAWDEYIDSFILGGLTGGVAGGVGGVFSRTNQTNQTNTPTQNALQNDGVAQEVEQQIAEADPEGVLSQPLVQAEQQKQAEAQVAEQGVVEAPTTVVESTTPVAEPELAPAAETVPEVASPTAEPVTGVEQPVAVPEATPTTAIPAAETTVGQAVQPVEGVKAEEVVEAPRPGEIVEPAAKEPWQMTREEYFEQGKEYVTTDERGDHVTYYPREGAIERKARGQEGHKFHINQALREGKPVPPEVLKDYPDLAPKAAIITAPAVEGGVAAVKPAVPITEPKGAENAAPATINTDAGESTTGRLLRKIENAIGGKKDNLYLSTYGKDREMLLEDAILKNHGTYTLSIEGRVAQPLQGFITERYGAHAGADVTEQLIRGMTAKYPSQIKATFTHGLQEIIVSPIKGKAAIITAPATPSYTLTRDIVEKVFPGQSILQTGTNFMVTTKNGAQVQIEGVDYIDPNAISLKINYNKPGLKPGERIGGQYLNGEIKVLRKNADARFLLAHESVHWLEDLGIIGPQDQMLINTQAKKEGLWKSDLSPEENRANWLADFHVGTRPKTTALGRLWDKIKEFVNRIVGIRTAQAVGREFKSGKLYEKPAANRYLGTPRYAAMERENGEVPKTQEAERGIGKVGGNREAVEAEGDSVLREPSVQYSKAELRATQRNAPRYSVITDAITAVRNAYETNEEGLPPEAVAAIDKGMNTMSSKRWAKFRQTFDLPYNMAQRFADWKRAYDLAVQRNRNRLRIIFDTAQIAAPYLQRDKMMKEAGYTKAERKDTDYRVGRALTITDDTLPNFIQSLKQQANEKGIDPAVRGQLEQRIAWYEKNRRYSDDDLRKGLMDSDGKLVKLNTDLEIAMYQSVRASLDHLFKNMVDHFSMLAFRNYRDKKWYRLLVSAAGVDLSSDTVNTLLGEKGLNSATVAYNKKIQADLATIWQRINAGIEAMPDAEKQGAANLYARISDSLQADLTSIRNYLSEITGEKDAKKLEALTRELFAAYQRTLPLLKKIKKLRNDVQSWPGFFPRRREQGDLKIKVLEHEKDPVTGEVISTKEHHSQMYKTRSEGIRLYKELLDRYGTDGKLSANFEIIAAEPVVKTPEGAFQGVNDMNTQRVIQDAIKNMREKGEVFDAQGQPIDVEEALLDNLYEAIAGQMQSRGAGASLLKRKQAVGESAIKGYDEENHDRILLSHIGAMSGLMTKQQFALDALGIMKGLEDKNLHEEIQKYFSNQLRNTTELDRLSGNLRTLAFTWFLGASIRSAAVNGTQPIIVGIPMLGRYMRENGVGGFARANRVQLKASKDLATNNLSAQDKQVIEQLRADGTVLDQHMRLIRGTFSPNDAVMNQMTDVIAYPFSKMEKFNRESSALAMFRTAYDNYQRQGLAADEAYDRAMTDTHKFVDDVHYPLGQHNLPLMAQGGDITSVGIKTLYVFRTFTHNFIAKQYDLLRREGKTEAQIRNDMKTFIHTMAFMALFGGLMGSPFIKDLFEWYEKEFGRSPTKYVRKMLRGVGGETLETFGMSGLPALLGANISGSLAIGVPFMGETPTDSIYGVWGGLKTRGGRAYEAAKLEDWYRVITNLMPEFVRGPITAAQESQIGRELFGTPGYATTSRGRPIYDSEGKPLSLSTYEAALRTVGFNPTVSAREKEMNRIIKREEVWVADQKEQIGARYRLAREQGKPDAMRNMVQEVRDLRKEIRDRGLEPLVSQITVAKVLQSSRRLRTAKERREQRYKQNEM